MTDMRKKSEIFPDESALRQLSRALWRDGSVRGAAVMVGAGMSKNAARPGEDTPEPPLWHDLANGLISRLYPDDPDAAPKNSLRLAEEYRTFFGQAGLDDFIRSNVPDRAWSPGSLHFSLLDLPWTDILTTNWDTLLERASEVVEPTYSIVRSEVDLTYAKSPRIVKLHGSIGDERPLIFAEEDYRKYPSDYAAFVNLARQIFIENELVLVGFSGDDPNFLHWAGWVRDHLSGSARRIYLAGNLNLQPVARKYLESINIVPIDLASLVEKSRSQDRHAEAIRLLVEQLKDGKPKSPHVWQRTEYKDYPTHNLSMEEHQRLWKDPHFAAELLKSTAKLYEAERARYPGWPVCPIQYRSGLAHQEGALFRKSVLDLIERDRRAAVIYESVWRHETSYSPLGQPVTETIAEAFHTCVTDTDSDLRWKLALALAAEARLLHDKDGLKVWTDFVLDGPNAPESYRQEAYYQICLRARDVMALDQLTAELAKLNSDDPIWQLRRAALLTEIGAYAKANDLIRAASTELERRLRLDRGSLWIKARLAWASWIQQASRAWVQNDQIKRWEFRELDVDPAEEINYFDKKASRIQHNKREEEVAVKPAFDVGHYREGKRRDRAEDHGEALRLAYEFDKLTASIGVPLSINHINIGAGSLLAVLDTGYQRTVEWHVAYLRSVHSHYDKSFDRYFGRIAIAQLDKQIAEELASKVEKAITFWTKRVNIFQNEELQEDKSRAIDALRLLLHSLSRLVVRLSLDDAARVFDLALAQMQDASLLHPWLTEATGALALNALKSIPVTAQGELAFKLIKSPLPAEKKIDARFWPSLISAIWNATPVRRLDDRHWDDEIKRLIRAAEKGQMSRSEAILRLFYLSKRGVLKQDERENFGRALWSDTSDSLGELPANASLLDSALAELPAPSGVDVTARLGMLFSVDLRELMEAPANVDTRVMASKQNRLASLANLGPTGIKPSADQAAQLFDQVTSWTPVQLEKTDSINAGFIQQFNDNLARIAGVLLNVTIVSAMTKNDLGEERAHKIIDFIGRVQRWEALASLPAFLASAPKASATIVSALRAGLSSPNSQRAGNAASAISMWGNIADSPPIPRLLVEQIMFNIEAGKEAGLPAMIDTAIFLLKAGLLENGDPDRLGRALQSLLEDFDYRDVEWESRKAVLVSLVRSQCVRLASALQEFGCQDNSIQDWLSQVDSDPLPEVRHSLLNATNGGDAI